MRVRHDRDCGFTLIEVLVAICILMCGAMAAAGLFNVAAVARQMALVETQATLLAAAKMEQLQSLLWGYDSSGAPVSDLGTDLSIEPAANGGVGLSVSPVDALDRNYAGYVDYLDAGGAWVGTGPAVSPLATYVRRWSVQPLAEYPRDVLVVRVFVTTVVREALRIIPTGIRYGPDASLVVVRTRLRR